MSKNLRKILKGGIVWLFLSMNILNAQNAIAPAFAFLDSNTFVIGDKIILHIGVDYQQTDKLINTTPEIPLDTTIMEILGKGNWSNGGRGRDWGTHRDIAFTVWDTGLYKISSIVFTVQHSNNYISTHTTKPLLFTVINPKGVDIMNVPISIKDIEHEESTFEDYGIYIFTLIIFPILTYFLWKIYTKKKEKSTPIVSTPKVYESPQVKALRLLKELKIKQLCEKGYVKEYYSQLSYILRGYYEEAYKIPALESTTDELLLELKKHHRLNVLDNKQDILNKTHRLLDMSDLVKFAKAEPSLSEHDIYWSDALEIVEKYV
jgi:hypothetical protein